jgi:Mg2+ and Co2+ transporter CorA
MVFDKKLYDELREIAEEQRQSENKALTMGESSWDELGRTRDLNTRVTEIMQQLTKKR